jgi:hypothetical protein
MLRRENLISYFFHSASGNGLPIDFLGVGRIFTTQGVATIILQVSRLSCVTICRNCVLLVPSLGRALFREGWREKLLPAVFRVHIRTS